MNTKQKQLIFIYKNNIHKLNYEKNIQDTFNNFKNFDWQNLSTIQQKQFQQVEKNYFKSDTQIADEYGEDSNIEYWIFQFINEILNIDIKFCVKKIDWFKKKKQLIKNFKTNSPKFIQHEILKDNDVFKRDGIVVTVYKPTKVSNYLKPEDNQTVLFEKHSVDVKEFDCFSMGKVIEEGEVLVEYHHKNPIKSKVFIQELENQLKEFKDTCITYNQLKKQLKQQRLENKKLNKEISVEINNYNENKIENKILTKLKS